MAVMPRDKHQARPIRGLDTQAPNIMVPPWLICGN